MRYKVMFHSGETEEIKEYTVKDEITTVRTASGFYRQVPAYLESDHQAKIYKLAIGADGVVWQDVSKFVKYVGIDTSDMIRFEIKIGDSATILGGVALEKGYSLKDAVEMIYRGVVRDEPDTVEYSVCAKI